MPVTAGGSQSSQSILKHYAQELVAFLLINEQDDQLEHLCQLLGQHLSALSVDIPLQHVGDDSFRQNMHQTGLDRRHDT